MTIGEKIFELRKKKGVSQEMMAFDLAVSRQAVSKWETDQSIPDLDKIKLLAEYFNVTIDYLVNDVKIETVEEEKQSIDQNKTNSVKRLVKLMLKTSIAFNIIYFVYLIYCTFFQNILLPTYKDISFVFPWVSFIEFTVINGFYIFVAFYLLHQLKQDSKMIKDKIAFLIIFASTILISVIFPTLETYLMNAYDDEFMRKYLELYNLIQRYSIITSLATLMLIVSISLLIVVKINDSTRYRLPMIKKEYRTRDSILSFLVGLICGIPGLVFEILWLLDAKSDNKFRFKKMRFWYIIGFIITLIISLLLLLIEILSYL